MAGPVPVRMGRIGGALSDPFSDLAAWAAIVAVAACYYLIGPTLPSLALLALLALLCWRRTALAVTAIPLALPLYMLPKQLHLVRHLDFSLGETAIVLCAAIVLAQQALSLRRPAGVTLWRHFLPRSVFEVPAAVFLLAGTLATLLAHFHGVAFRQYREVILEPMLYYWLILQRLRDALDAARLVLAVVGTGVLIAGMGAYQILFRSRDMAVSLFTGGAPLHLVRAVYGNENNLALLLDRAIPMALAMALLIGWLPLPATLPPDRVATRTRLVQLALLLGSALMAAILYKTNSRGGELTLGTCLAVLFVLWQWRRPAVLAAGMLLAAAALFVARRRISDALGGGHGLTNDARISLWHSALRMLRDHPLIGVGPDNFLYYYSNDRHCAPGHIEHYYYNQLNDAGKPVNFEPCLSHPHNLFLDLWLSTGVLGLLAGTALLVLFTALGIRAYRRSDEAWRGPLLAALIAMLAMLVHGQVDNSYFLPDLAGIFWLCLGVVALWWRRDRAPNGRAGPRPAPRPPD